MDRRSANPEEVICSVVEHDSDVDLTDIDPDQNVDSIRIGFL